MPSIFIWKASEPCTSKRQLRYYSGSNWFLEDNDYSSKSYVFLDQIVLSEFDNSVITYHAKRMPQDWVGTELLEVIQVPYEHIKSDNYGTLEHIGNWMRFTSKGEFEYDEESLAREFNTIKRWMTLRRETCVTNELPPSNNNHRKQTNPSNNHTHMHHKKNYNHGRPKPRGAA
jgi:hypothetical protein